MWLQHAAGPGGGASRHVVRVFVERGILAPLNMGTRYKKLGRPPEMFWSYEIVKVLMRRDPLPPKQES